VPIRPHFTAFSGAIVNFGKIVFAIITKLFDTLILLDITYIDDGWVTSLRYKLASPLLLDYIRHDE